MSSDAPKTDGKIFSGQASIDIQRPVGDVFAAVTDVSRMGEWSPECTGGEWVEGATGPALGAKFAGHNHVAIKKWTTISEVTDYQADAVFEFLAAGQSTWRYEFAATDTGTHVTESFSYPPTGGVRGFFYDTVLRRESGMTKGMNTTLQRLKSTLES